MSELMAMLGKPTCEHVMPHLSAQASDLLVVWTAWSEQGEPFAPGDRVVFKPGLNFFRCRRCGDRMVFVFVRYLDRDDPLDLQLMLEPCRRGIVEPLDCVAGVLDSDGDFCLSVFSSRRFRAYVETLPGLM